MLDCLVIAIFLYYFLCRYIAEICEGSKLLEDQLRLMDEKYLDMRKKLDYAREQNRVDVGRAEKQASSLRRKFQALTGSTKVLDSYNVPESHESGRAVSWADFPSSPTQFENDQRFGQSTKRIPSRVRSAPSKRATTSKSAIADPDPPNIDKILHKIEKKRLARDSTWVSDFYYLRLTIVFLYWYSTALCRIWIA